MATYKLKRHDGSEIEKQLAEPTNKSLVKVLGALGIKSYSDIVKKPVESLITRLDVALDAGKLRTVLDNVLVGGVDDVDIENTPSAEIDMAIQDFFELRSKKLIERQNSLPTN